MVWGEGEGLTRRELVEVSEKVSEKVSEDG